MRLFSILKAFIFSLAVVFPAFAFAQSIEEAIGALAEKLGTQMSAEGTERLAIYGFSDLNGFESALGDFISEELTTSLFGAGDFAIVERNEFERVLSEHERYASDIFNSETIAELGEFLAIQALITGSVTQFDDSIRINARAIDVSTGRVFAAASASVQKDGMVNSLLNQRSRASNVAMRTVPGAIAQSSDTYFQNEIVRIEPVSVLSADDKTSFRVTVEIKNTTGTDIYMTGNYSVDLFATTKHGDSLDITASGMNLVSNNNDYVLIPVGSAATVVFNGKSKSGSAILGGKLMIRWGVYYHTGNKNNWSEFQVLLDNISI